MREDEIIELSEEDVEKIERVRGAIAACENAAAARESHQKLRVLFERTPVEALPFVAYAVYIGVFNSMTLFRIVSYDGVKLGVLAFLLIVATLAPILILPRESLWWLKDIAAGTPEEQECNGAGGET